MRRRAAARLLSFSALAAAALVACAPRRPEPPPLPAEIGVALRGHQEVEVRPDGSLLPRVLGHVDLFGQPVALLLCLETPPTTDTSQWRARLWLTRRDPGGELEPPRLRLDSTLCFAAELPAELPEEEKEIELCGVVRDFDGSGFRLPCQSLRLRRDDPRYRTLLAALRTPLQQNPSLAMIADLDRVAAEAGDAGYPLLATQANLIAAHYLGEMGDADAAGRRLDRLPPWLEQDAAAGWGAQEAYARGLLEMWSDWKAAWQTLRLAERLCRRVGHSIHFVVRMKQAEILSWVGATSEGVDRLARALDDCRAMPCNPRLLPSARGQLAWLILLDPRSGATELERARGYLEEALAGVSKTDDPLEYADHLINLAYLRVLLGQDPSSSLAEAKALIEEKSGSERAHQLDRWVDLIAGLAALEDGRLDRALELCGSVVKDGKATPQVAAWARSCAGRVHRRHGDLRRAAAAFEEALVFHELAAPAAVGQNISPRLGRRSEDAYLAARVAVERGDATAGWRILEQLDSISGAQHADCPGSVRGAGGEPERATRRAALLRELIALDGPTSGPRRGQVERLRQGLMEKLQELVRQGSGCAAADNDRDAGAAVRFRAFPVDSEILLLRRDPGAEVVLERRTELDAAELRRLAADISTALGHRASASRDDEDGVWRRRLEPLAAALVPRALDALEPVTTFALHGTLQAVPLAALPLAGDRARWLGAATTVALHPAGATAVTTAPGSGVPLFVVDPRGDLPSGRELATMYHDLFPDGLILRGKDAGRAAFERALADAGWLHVDAHGLYDPAFPELSSLRLADRPILLSELAELRPKLAFANLSGCRTGSWPTTADSGRYGIAGLFARRGASWVIASRTDLADALARDFQRAFYPEIATGRTVPEAYARALETVRRDYPANAWGALLLLRGPAPGQSAAPTTPQSTEGRVPGSHPASAG